MTQSSTISTSTISTTTTTTTTLNNSQPLSTSNLNTNNDDPLDHQQNLPSSSIIHHQRATATKIRKTKQLVTFTPRLSTFDHRNQIIHQNPLRGLFVLFWILLTFHIIATLHASGSLSIQSPLARLFSKHLPQLALVDLCLIGSTFSALGFSKITAKGYFKYSPTGLIIQHVFQFLWLACWISFIFYLKWPWIQSGFLTLHSITMLMKIHSYCATNGEYCEKFVTLKQKLKQIRGTIDQVLESSGIEEETNGKESSLVSDLIKSGVVRNLHLFLDKQKEKLGENGSADDHLEVVQQTLDLIDELSPKITSHKDDDDEDEQVIQCPLERCWPQNLTAINFIDYLLIPTLVYELQYPRTKEIRPFFVIEKILATAGIFGLLYMITQYYIWDQVTNVPISDQDINLVDHVIRLTVPFTINYLLIFYIIFECICNAFAELTRFADREFYSDWWNSCSFDEFSRKWNKPVHNFLLKHVYASTISSYGVSRSAAALITLFLSSLVHELLMVIVTRKMRPYLFLAQMTQLPLTYIGRSKFFKSRPGFANVFFWVGLMSGFPLLGVCYIFY